ncbi:MAG: type II 3-dehydroquinate dehydratase [Pseudomonadota bacterium]
MKKILILNGPNLNLLGKREPDKYGSATLADVEAMCAHAATELGFEVDCKQSNHEGELIDAVQKAGAEKMPVVFNPGAFSHTSVALRDAISGSDAEIYEVHITNIHARERFRHHSHVSPVAKGVIAGFGVNGYLLAIQAIAENK